MTIEIHSPEAEEIMRRRLSTGGFRSQAAQATANM
jgi:hypothetical protein